MRRSSSWSIPRPARRPGRRCSPPSRCARRSSGRAGRGSGASVSDKVSPGSHASRAACRVRRHGGGAHRHEAAEVGCEQEANGRPVVAAWAAARVSDQHWSAPHGAPRTPAQTSRPRWRCWPRQRASRRSCVRIGDLRHPYREAVPPRPRSSHARWPQRCRRSLAQRGGAAARSARSLRALARLSQTPAARRRSSPPVARAKGTPSAQQQRESARIGLSSEYDRRGASIYAICTQHERRASSLGTTRRESVPVL